MATTTKDDLIDMSSTSKDVDMNSSQNNVQSSSQKRKSDILSPDINVSYQQKKYVWDSASLIKQNKFYLPDDVQSQIDVQSASTDSIPKNKIPPIFLYNANNYKTIVDDIKAVIANDDFTMQCRTTSVKINLTNSTDFRKLTAFYDEKEIQYHTFQNPDDTLLSVAIRNLPISISTEEIHKELSKSYPVKRVTRLLNKEKCPIPLCIVDLTREAKANDIFNLTKYDHSIISVEPRRKSRDIPQCTRCQRYGHTKNYCKLEPRCVKCSSKHHYKDCPKRPNEAPTCVNCGENHTANYRGCRSYADLKSKINRQQQRSRMSLGNNHDSHRIPSSHINHATNNFNQSSQETSHSQNRRSYADAARSTRDQQPNMQSTSFSNIIDTLIELVKPYLNKIKEFLCTVFTSMFAGFVQSK